MAEFVLELLQHIEEKETSLLKGEKISAQVTIGQHG